MEGLERLIGKLISTKFWLHVIFIMVFVSVFAISVLLSGNMDIAGAAMLTCLFILVCTYVGRWCGKSSFSTGRYKVFLQRFVLSVLILTIAGATSAGYLYKGSILKYFTQYLTISFPLVVLFVFFGMAIALAKNSLLKQVSQAQVLQQQKESELSLLLSQLSPHFLFNTLNNIYGISITQHQKVPELLLMLSELLRYSVYETREQFIPLKNELLYIHNYIEFEKIQTGEKLVLESQIEEINNTNLQIAPMVLIVFVENAFKFSKCTRDPKIFVTIDLSVKNGWIYFSIENSYDSLNQKRTETDDPLGIGLHHTLKRLELIYGKDCIYNASQRNGTYKVELSLKANRV